MRRAAYKTSASVESTAHGRNSKIAQEITCANALDRFRRDVHDAFACMLRNTMAAWRPETFFLYMKEELNFMIKKKFVPFSAQRSMEL